MKRTEFISSQGVKATLPFRAVDYTRSILACHVIRPTEGTSVANVHNDAFTRLFLASSKLLEIAEEIANDPYCNLVNSERRLRLYAAITEAGGTLDENTRTTTPAI